MSNQRGFLQIFLFALILILGIILFIFARKQLAMKPASKPLYHANLNPKASIPQTTAIPTFQPTTPTTSLPLQTASSSASHSSSISGIPQ